MAIQKRNIPNLISLIKYPLITEKTTKINENTTNIETQTYIVERSLTKSELKKIFETVFNIKVLKINTSILSKKKKTRGRTFGYKPVYKKASLKVEKSATFANIFSS